MRLALPTLLVIAVGQPGCAQQAKRGEPDGAQIDAGSELGGNAPSDLRGVVTDSHGTAIPDVLVIAWPQGKRGEAIAQARSDEQGRFILPRLRPDRWALLVEAGGLGTLESEQTVPASAPVTLILEAESRVLTGRVTDSAGSAQRDAEVELASPGLRWTRHVRSDANGAFAVPGLGSGRYTLRAQRGGEVSATAVVAIDGASPSPGQVRLALQPGIVVEGRVVDDAGHPLAGASIAVMATPADDLPVSAQSGRDGKFRVGPIGPGRVQFLARLDDYVALEVPEARLGSHPSQWIELRLARAAKLAGRVVDEDGRPLSDALVSALSLVGGQDDMVVIAGPVPLAAEAADLPIALLGKGPWEGPLDPPRASAVGQSPPPLTRLLGKGPWEGPLDPPRASAVGQSPPALTRLLRTEGVRSGMSDDEGRFVISGLAPGRTRIEVQHAGKLPCRRGPLPIAPGAEVEVGDLIVRAGATLTGMVTDGDAVVEGAVVEARMASDPLRVPVRASTDAKGEFFLRLPLGDYLLSAQTARLVTPQPLAVAVRSDVAADSCHLRLFPRTTVTSGSGARGSRPRL
ncbi:MAG: carboxypeptidase-like regulatory domain-containing protein [Polyangia bacterium]